MASKLSKMQADFVAHVSKGVERTQAARLAGFAFPGVEAVRLMKLPHVVQALRDRRNGALQGDLAAVAVETIRELMGPETPAATRYQASTWVLKRAGHDMPSEAQVATKTLDEMDADELAQAVANGMEALQEIAGQLQDKHIIDGQLREVATIENESQQMPDFLD